MTERVRCALVDDKSMYTDENIIDVCSHRDIAGEEVDGSVFFVSRRVWAGMYRRYNGPLERVASGFRLVLVTPFAVLFVEADPAIPGEEVDVIWGGAFKYEDCIRQSEIWMQRAVDLRGTP